jgi:hypothetical protein
MFTFADYAFWAGETVGYLLVSICILLSRSTCRWWSVSTYCILQTSINSALFLMCWRQTWSAYFYTLWLSGLVLLLLKLAILLQVVISGLSSLKAAPISLRMGFGIASFTCASIAFVTGIKGNAPGSGLALSVLLANRAVSMAVVAVFAVFALFSAVLDLKLERRTLLIDTGLTLMASNDLLCFLGEITFPKKVLTIYRVQSAIDLVAIAVWCIAFISSGKRSTRTDEMRDEVLQVARREIFQINSENHRGTR